MPADAERLAVRMIHGSGQVDLADDLVVHHRVVSAARAALDAGAPILCDATMVATGVTRSRLPKDNDVVCTLNDPRTPGLAAELGTTRTAAALELWRDRLDGAVVNAQPEWEHVARAAEALGVPAKVVLARAAALAAKPPESLRITKKLLRDPLRPAVDDAFARESALFAQRLGSAEAREAFSAFLAKKK